MDDVIFQCKNENSIYVLNSNYKSYGDFARLNLIESNTSSANKRGETANCHHSLTAKLASRSRSTVSRTLQHKLRNFGSFSSNGAEQIGNPPAYASTSSSTASASSTCLPAAAALQKLFTCSNAGSVPGNCINVAPSAQPKRDGSYLPPLHDDGCLNLEPCLTGMSSYCKDPKKKCFNVKSSLIAKKTKFWQLLEDEKRIHSDENDEGRISNYIEDPKRTTKGTGSSTGQTECQRNSSVKESNASLASTSMASATTCGPLKSIKHDSTKCYSPDETESNAVANNAINRRRQNQLNNWSGSRDSNSQQTLPQQHQQYEGNYQLYKEAAELMGLPCTLCDNCRCLDCQSSYFDCDDWDNCSDLSCMDEYIDDVDSMSNAIELVMYANYFGENVSSLTQNNSEQMEHRARSFPAEICTSTKYNNKGSGENATDNDNIACFCNTQSNFHENSLREGEYNDKTAIKPVENECQGEVHLLQCQNTEFENCVSFSGLSLVDAEENVNTHNGKICSE